MRRKLAEQAPRPADQAAQNAQVVRCQIDHQAKINLLLGAMIVLVNSYVSLSSEIPDEKRWNFISLILASILTSFSSIIFLKKTTELIPADFLDKAPDFVNNEKISLTSLSCSFIAMLFFAFFSTINSSSSNFLSPFFGISYVFFDLIFDKVTKKSQAKIREQDDLCKIFEDNLKNAFKKVCFGKKILENYFYIQRNSAGLILYPSEKLRHPELFSGLLKEHFAQFGVRAVLRERKAPLSLTISTLMRHSVASVTDMIVTLGLENLIEKVCYAERALDFFESLKIKYSQMICATERLVVSGLASEPIFSDLGDGITKTRSEDGTWSLALKWTDEGLFQNLERYRRENKQPRPAGVFQGPAPSLPLARWSDENPQESVPKTKSKTRKGPAYELVPVGESKPEPVICFGEYGIYDPARVDLSDPTQIQRLELHDKGRHFVVYVCASPEAAQMFEPGAWESLQVTLRKSALERWLSLDITGKRKCNGNRVWATVCKHQQHHIISTEAFKLQFPPNAEHQPLSFFVLLNGHAGDSLFTTSGQASVLPILPVDYREATPSVGLR